jgi:hypothetical protein
LASSDAALRIEVEKDIVLAAPALADKPSLNAMAQSSFLLEWLMNKRDNRIASV